MQTNNLVMDKELDSFSSKGSTDAKLNKDVSVDLGKIKPAARNIYYHIKAQYSGVAEKAKMQFSQCEEKIENLKESIESKKEKLKALTQVPGIYVPEFYVPEYTSKGSLKRIHAIELKIN